MVGLGREKAHTLSSMKMQDKEETTLEASPAAVIGRKEKEGRGWNQKGKRRLCGTRREASL